MEASVDPLSPRDRLDKSQSHWLPFAVLQISPFTRQTVLDFVRYRCDCCAAGVAQWLRRWTFTQISNLSSVYSDTHFGQWSGKGASGQNCSVHQKCPNVTREHVWDYVWRRTMLKASSVIGAFRFLEPVMLYHHHESLIVVSTVHLMVD